MTTNLHPEVFTSLHEGGSYQFAFLRVDIVSHSEITRTLPLNEISPVFDAFETWVEQVAASREGAMWSWLGDGGLCAFLGNGPSEKAQNAYAAAAEILTGIPIFNDEHPLGADRQVRVRLAVHIGFAQYREAHGRIHSPYINFVSHLEARKTHPESISISEHALQQLKAADRARFFDIGSFENHTVYTTVDDKIVQAQLRASSEGDLDRVAVRRLGITRCIPTLEGSEWEPRACLPKVRRDLRFSGIFGAKWVRDGTPLENFDGLLRRLSVQEGHVRFLLVNPFGTAVAEIIKARKIEADKEDLSEILEKYLGLMARYPSCLEVRLFDHLPHFRIVIRDDELMAVSRYKVWQGREYGMKAPHMILVKDPEPESDETNNMYDAFYGHFEHMWRAAKAPSKVLRAKK
jgi:class 3 adenylate cyclase